MIINTKDLVSMSEANQNFSQVAKRVDETGAVVVLKNNKPKYIIANIDEQLILTENERLEIIAKRILQEHAHAFKELAK